MTTKKITELTESIVAPVADDLLVLVVDTDTVPVTKSIKVSNFTHVTAETNDSNIFAVSSPGFASTFDALINGDPTNVANSVVTFDTVSAGGVAVITPTAAGQLARMRLYNTTRGNYALIVSATGATVTVDRNVKTLADPWENNDIITILSPTVIGGSFSWCDLEIISGPLNASSLFCTFVISSTTPGDTFRSHEFGTYGAGKVITSIAQVNGITNHSMRLVKVVSNVFTIAWTGTSATIMQIREQGRIV